MARLLSVNVGLPRDIGWNGQTVHTAVWKQPVLGRRAARRLNLDGDGQGDLVGHGGEHRAVLVYQIGSALFEVTQPRVTCYRVGIRMNEPRMAALLTASGKPGFYLRVLQEGEVAAGDPIVKVAAASERMSIAAINALLYLPGHPRSQLERALRIPALSDGWRGRSGRS
jgi:MOSC domain-containing protein YiiM